MLSKNKETGISIGVFFHILHEVHGSSTVVSIEIPEWKLKAELPRNTTFEEN